SSRRRHTRSKRDWSSDVCSSDLQIKPTTADQIAVLAHEQAKINALIDNGSNVLQLIDQADERRLTALADWAETSDRVLSSPDPEIGRASCRERGTRSVCAGEVEA